MMQEYIDTEITLVVSEKMIYVSFCKQKDDPRLSNDLKGSF